MIRRLLQMRMRTRATERCAKDFIVRITVVTQLFADVSARLAVTDTEGAVLLLPRDDMFHLPSLGGDWLNKVGQGSIWPNDEVERKQTRYLARSDRDRQGGR